MTRPASSSSTRRARARASVNGTANASADGRPVGRARPAGPPLNAKLFQEQFQSLVDNVERVIKGKTDVVRLALVAMVAEGHVLFEDVPGVGKSMLARALGRSIDASVGRVQCTAQDSQYRQHYPTAVYDVIESGGKPVGRLYVDRWKREIRIMDIAILPEHRGKGIGTQLLLDLQREAAGVRKSLSIHVERFNPALRLYERLGFHVLEDKGVYFLMEWTPADDLT